LPKKEHPVHAVSLSVAPDDLFDRASDLLRRGRLGAARALIAAFAQLEPGSARRYVLEGRLAVIEGRLENALAAFNRAITEASDPAPIHELRADVRMRLDDPAGAARDAAEAVILDPMRTSAKAVLGVAMIELGCLDDACACLAEAVAADPRNPEYRKALAVAQERRGEGKAAAATLESGIALTPAHVGLRNAAIVLALREREFERAADLASAARRDGVVDACTFGMLGHTLSSLGRHADAAQAYDEALKLGPEDPYVRHLVAASGYRVGADRAPVDYVRTVFDGYAGRFEEHLINLGYRVPGLIRRAFLSLLPIENAIPGPTRVLDLGCGTGLVGVVLADLPVGPFTGVDLSPGEVGRHANPHDRHT
jgi:tetratricopeptide (TPR) repeat protein